MGEREIEEGEDERRRRRGRGWELKNMKGKRRGKEGSA